MEMKIPQPAAQHTAPFVGRPMRRIEDAALLTGRGQYGDDVGVKPGTLHAAIVRSPHAHALINGIDSKRAEAAPGVRAVLTGRDMAAWSKPFVVGVKAPMEMWALAMETVRYAGEPVAVVVAESRYLAEDAVDLIIVDYTDVPCRAQGRRAREMGRRPPRAPGRPDLVHQPPVDHPRGGGA